MKTSEKCANGCIPSSPHVGCPVHGPEAKPPEPVKCRCHLEAGDSPCPLHCAEEGCCPPLPPEPEPYSGPYALVPRPCLDKVEAQLAASEEKRTAQRLRLGGRIIDLEAQLAAAQQDRESASKAYAERTVAWLAATDRAEKAERERDAAKNWAHARVERVTQQREFTQKLLDDAVAERDAERKRADAFGQQTESYRRESVEAGALLKQAEATAGALRASLRAIHSLRLFADGIVCACGGCSQCLSRAALAAHSKAVGP